MIAQYLGSSGPMRVLHSDLEPAEAVAGDEAGRDAGHSGQQLAQTQHWFPTKSIQEEQTGKVSRNLKIFSKVCGQ